MGTNELKQAEQAASVAFKAARDTLVGLGITQASQAAWNTAVANRDAALATWRQAVEARRAAR